MTTLRNERVRKELMRDISDILRKEVRGLEGVVSVVDVEVSHDNSYAKVIYSVLGSPEQGLSTLCPRDIFYLFQGSVPMYLNRRMPVCFPYHYLF